MESSKQTAEYLYSKYNKLTLTKLELCKETGIGFSTLNKYMAEGIALPNYKRIGNRIVFNIQDVADFLSNTVEVA